MLILVYGDDTFRVREKVAELRTAFTNKFDPTGLNITHFPTTADGKLLPEEILSAIGSLPFLAQRRLVLIRDLITRATKDEQEMWERGLAAVPESTIVVIEETGGEKELVKKSLFKILEKNSDIHRYCFTTLSVSALNKWVSARIKKRSGTIMPNALAELLSRVGSDLWQMDNEIGKLIAFAARASIDCEMVRKLVRVSFEGEIFALLDAISRRQAKEALRLLAEERAAGTDDWQIFSMLCRQTRILLSVRTLLDADPRATSSAIAATFSWHPFVASKALSQAKNFTAAELKTTHDLLFRFDVEMKSGVLNLDTAVDLIVADLVRPQKVCYPILGGESVKNF